MYLIEDNDIDKVHGESPGKEDGTKLRANIKGYRKYERREEEDDRLIYL